MAKKNKMKPRERREAQKKARQLKAAEINNNAVPAIAAMHAGGHCTCGREEKILRKGGRNEVYSCQRK